MEIDLLRWGTELNIMIIAEIAFSLECHILLDMIKGNTRSSSNSWIDICIIFDNSDIIYILKVQF